LTLVSFDDLTNDGLRLNKRALTTGVTVNEQPPNTSKEAATHQTNNEAELAGTSTSDDHSTSAVTTPPTTSATTSSELPVTTDSSKEALTSTTSITSSNPTTTQLHHTSTSLESTTIKPSTSASQLTPASSTVAPNTNSQNILISSTSVTTDRSFSSTLYSTPSFSITSSTAVPSLVLGKNECSSDAHATTDGMCANDYFCNAALKTCVALKNNGDQCYEDFQCLSSYCGQGNVCTVAPTSSSSVPLLSGGQIAGITVGCVAGAVVILLGLIRWQRRSRQVHLRAARFKDFENDDDLNKRSTARWSKYNFLTQALHSDSRMETTTNDDIDDSQFYGTLPSTDSSPHFYDPGLEMSSTSSYLGAQQNTVNQLALDSVPREALTRGVRPEHKPYQTTLDQKDYGYI
jgi:hypothetical protein